MRRPHPRRTSPAGVGPYRQAAEDVEAKEDAREVATFAEKLRRAKQRSLGLAALVGIVGTGAMLGAVHMIATLRIPSVRDTRHGCRTVYQISVRGNDVVRSEQLVCPDDDLPQPDPTVID